MSSPSSLRWPGLAAMSLCAAVVLSFIPPALAASEVDRSGVLADNDLAAGSNFARLAEVARRFAAGSAGTFQAGTTVVARSSSWILVGSLLTYVDLPAAIWPLPYLGHLPQSSTGATSAGP